MLLIWLLFFIIITLAYLRKDMLPVTMNWGGQKKVPTYCPLRSSIDEAMGFWVKSSIYHKPELIIPIWFHHTK